MNGFRERTPRRTTGPCATLAACAMLLAAGQPFGESSAASSQGSSCPLLSPQEVSFRFAYGIGDRDSLKFYTFGPRVAYDLLPSLIPAIAGNRIRIDLEATGSIIHGDHQKLDGEFA